MINLISPHGGYKNLKSFQMAEIVYDITSEFINRYVTSYKDKEQKQGAARGGKQNIGEGSQTSGTSKQSEPCLIEVARASQEELKLDYEDFLRKRQLAFWPKEDPRALAIRKLAYEEDRSYRTYMTYMSDPEPAANCMLCLINQTCYLLDRQLKSLENDLRENGDFKNRYKQAQDPYQNRLDQDKQADAWLEQSMRDQGYIKLENGQWIDREENEKLN